jgi:hypothetical protein
MSNEFPDFDDRFEQQYRRLGTRTPVCICCGETDPFCLELHHLAGRQHHEDVVIVCRNCHRKLTNQQHDHTLPGVTGGAGSLADEGRYLLGLADLYARLVPTLRKFAEHLIAASKRKE